MGGGVRGRPLGIGTIKAFCFLRIALTAVDSFDPINEVPLPPTLDAVFLCVALPMSVALPALAEGMDG